MDVAAIKIDTFLHISKTAEGYNRRYSTPHCRKELNVPIFRKKVYLCLYVGHNHNDNT